MANYKPNYYFPVIVLIINVLQCADFGTNTYLQ
jgi:hypothetical protein